MCACEVISNRIIRTKREFAKKNDSSTPAKEKVERRRFTKYAHDLASPVVNNEEYSRQRCIINVITKPVVKHLFNIVTLSARAKKRKENRKCEAG